MYKYLYGLRLVPGLCACNMYVYKLQTSTIEEKQKCGDFFKIHAALPCRIVLMATKSRTLLVCDPDHKTNYKLRSSIRLASVSSIMGEWIKTAHSSCLSSIYTYPKAKLVSSSGVLQLVSCCRITNDKKRLAHQRLPLA